MTPEEKLERIKTRMVESYNRRHEALRLKEEDGLTLDQIGARLGGITKQRVSIMVKEAEKERDAQ